MKYVLSFFVILLSICLWPVFLQIPIEIQNVFGLIEEDIFTWYRMWLVAAAGLFFLFFTKYKAPKALIFYALLLFISTLSSDYFRTSLFGAPWNHEGALALIGYIGIYLASRKYGTSNILERSFDIVIVIAFIAAISQYIYGSPLKIPLLKYLVPNYVYETIGWPFYSVFGNGNHLGLFCSLFFPYTLLRKKYFLSTLLLFIAIGSEARAAWLSLFITTLLIGRKTTLCVALLAIALATPLYKDLLPKIERSTKLIHYPIKNEDFSGRIYLWKESIPQLKKTLLIGMGPGTFAMKFPQRQFIGHKVVDRPHNLYIQIWTGTGLVSLLILMTSIMILLFNSRDKAIALSVIGYLINAFFTDSVLSVTPYFIIFLGILSYKEKELLSFNN